jgi:uncharacterized protein (TIGR00297 family)
MVGWAFLLRVLTWPQAALLAVIALLFNFFVLPRIAGRVLYRNEQEAGGFPGGIVFYALSVLILILVFRPRLDIVAAAWAILAVGDGMATIAGRAIGGPRIPWNPDKTIAGSAAFAVAGGAAGVVLCWWTQPNVPHPAPVWFVVGAPLAAAGVAALVETIPVRLDDNLSVPFAAAATLWIASLVDVDRLRAFMPMLTARLVPGVQVNAGFALLAYAFSSVRWSGVIVGALIGIVVWVGLHWYGWVMLFAAFVVATVASKLGERRKASLGIAEPHGGRRGAGNALANCLVSTVAAALWPVLLRQETLLVFATGLTAGASDTVASEIGKAWGRRTVLIVSFRPVPPGTPGAISLEGTIANVVAAAALAALAIAIGVIPTPMGWIVVAAALLGSLVESVLAATLEHRSILNNDLLNFITTGVAAAAAVWMWHLASGM